MAKTETLGKAAHVAQVLWMMSVDEDERKEDDKVLQWPEKAFVIKRMVQKWIVSLIPPDVA